MTLEFFLLASLAGLLATYVHLMFALWGPRYGVARLDFCKVLNELSFGESYDGPPPYWLGWPGISGDTSMMLPLYSLPA